MAKAGDEIANPRTGQRMVFLETGEETGGELLRIDSYNPPSAPLESEHVHPFQESGAEVISGSLRFRVGGEERSVKAGESITIPVDTPHHFWNDGEEVAHSVQWFKPALKIDRFFESYFGLAQDGKLNEEGFPSFWQLALMVPYFGNEIRMPSPPWAAQRVIFGLLAPIGRMLGYRPEYPYPHDGDTKVPAKGKEARPLATREAISGGIVVAVLLATIALFLKLLHRSPEKVALDDMNSTTMSQLEPPTTLWQHLLSAQEEESLVRAAFSRRAGLGRTLAILVIDVQNYMVGPIGDEPYDYPSSCGEIGLEAVRNISVLLKTARSLSLPIFYTRFEVRADGADMGVYRLKRAFMQTAGWAIRGSFGARIVEAIAPEPQDFVLTKNKPSAFLGTPLHGLLIERGIDTLIVAEGSTSNCVRATVVDAASLNYRVLIPAECVFDRIDISHRVALFDMDRQYGDVVGLEDLLPALRNVESNQKPEAVTGRSQESR